MILADQVYAQAMLLAGVDAASQPMLQLLCRSAVAGLTARLRNGIKADDCKADFVAAASLYALAALSEIDELQNLEQVQIGDVTLKRGGNSAARCLRAQAELLMFPYLKDRFVFRGV